MEFLVNTLQKFKDTFTDHFKFRNGCQTEKAVNRLSDFKDSPFYIIFRPFTKICFPILKFADSVKYFFHLKEIEDF